MTRIAAFACALFAAVVGLACPNAADAAGDLYYSLEYRPKFHIPRVDTPPDIEGKIYESQWRQAVKLQGMSGPQSPQFFGRRVTFWLAWDAEHLYLAARSSIREGEKLVKQKREPREMGVVFDDSHEFGIDTSDIHQPEDEAPFFFKFILNALAAGEYQKIYPTIGQAIYNWRPSMDIANRIWADETGQRWWDLQLAIDRDDLALPRKFRAGDRIRINLARNFKYPWAFSNVPSPSGYLVSRGFPEAVLVDDKPFVRIERLEGLLDRRIDLRARIVNPGDQPRKVSASLTIRNRKTPKTSGDAVHFTEARTLTLPAGGSKIFAVDRSLEHKSGFMHLLIQPAGEADAPPIYDYQLSFAEDKEKKFLDYPRDLPDFPLEARFNPVTQKLWLAGDTLDAKLDDRSAAAAMTYHVHSKDKPNETIQSGRITRYARYKYLDVLDLAGLKPGEYEVTCALVNEADETLLRRTVGFTESDESEKFAEWWGNDIGSPDQLLRPFEALKVERHGKGVQVSPVLRTYQLNALGLPRAIASNGGSLMQAPARLVVVVDGKQHVADLSGTVEVVDAKAYRVHFKGEATAAGLRFTTTGAVEQDGLVDLELTYEPTGDPVAIEHLRLEWPLHQVTGERANAGNSLVVIGSGGNYAVRKIGQVPAGDGVVWDTLNDLGLQGSSMIKGNFYGNVWVGTEQRGLLWAGDSDRGWVPSNTHPAHSVERKGSAVVIRNHLIGTNPDEQPFTLDHARTVRFQYNASPFKPLEPGFRYNLRSAGNGFGAIPGYMLNEERSIKGWSLLHPPTPDKSEWPAWYARWKEEAEKLNRQALYDVGRRQKVWNNTQIALRGYQKKSMEPGVYSHFLADWLPTGSGDELLTESYRDYMHHLQQRMVREAHMRQFYYDIAFASKIYHNLTNDTGYFLPDGRIQPETNDDELRAYVQRTYAMMQEHGIYPTGVTTHATNAFCLKALPFMDAVLDAEYPAKNPIDTYSSERMIAMSVPHAFGTGINHLVLGMNMRWAAMHDASPSGASTFRQQTFDHPTLHHWGITQDDVTFIPYWRNEHVVGDIGDGLLATIWERPHTILVGVMNHGKQGAHDDEKRELDVTLDLAALGIPAGLDGRRLRIREVIPPPTDKWNERLPVLEGVRIDGETGKITGPSMDYHRIRFFAVHWEDEPIRAERLAAAPAAARRALLDWGINHAQPVAVSTAGDAPIRTNNGDVDVQAWKVKGKLLLRLENPTDQPQRFSLALDLESIGVHVDTETEIYHKFYQLTAVHGLGTGVSTSQNREDAMNGADPGRAVFNGYLQTLSAGLKPGQVGYVSIDQY